MRVLFAILFIASVGSMSTHCNSYIAEHTDSVYMDYDYHKLGYKLFEPKEKHFLSYDLEEISGLSYYNAELLAAVEDEEGELYFIDSKTGDIKRKIKFGRSGDYEGVEIHDGKAYILRSDGDIYTFIIGDKDEVDAQKMETKLDDGNDAEGLGFLNGQLLIALKGSGDIKENKADGKAIYLFDLSSQKLAEKELFDFDKGFLDDFIEEREHFTRVHDFDPSGIAVHPATKNIYVISADKMLAVFSADYELKELIKLDPITYNQAEGICFAPDGTLYISSEGDGGKGKLIKIAYHPPE